MNVIYYPKHYWTKRNKAVKRANNRETVFPKFRKSTRHHSGRSNRRKNSTSPGKEAGGLEWVCNFALWQTHNFAHTSFTIFPVPPMRNNVVCRCRKPPVGGILWRPFCVYFEKFDEMKRKTSGNIERQYFQSCSPFCILNS